jgi:hypothetical protein
VFGLSAADSLKWANEVRILAMIGSAVFAVLALGAGWAQIRLQSTVGREKDAALDRYKADAAERTAVIERDTAEALREQEKLRNENLQLEKAIQQEQIKLNELRARVGPRTLTPLEAKKLSDGLTSALVPIVALVEAAHGSEEEAYGHQIAIALSGTCKVLWAPNSGMMIVGIRQHGVFCNGTAELLPLAKAAFRAANIDATFGTDPLPADRFDPNRHREQHNLWVNVMSKAPHV